MDRVEVKFVKEGREMNIGLESFVLEHVVAQEWNEDLHHVVDGGRVDVGTQGSSSDGVFISDIDGVEVDRGSNGSQCEKFEHSKHVYE